MRIATLLVCLAGCGNNPATNDMAADMSAICTGGPVAGAADSHCVGDGGQVAIVTVDPIQCANDAGGDSGGPDYGDTMYGTEGNDDDCKYHVSYTVDPICEGAPGATFIVTAVHLIDDSPVTGADPRADVTINTTHISPSVGTTTETSPGVYRVGPVVYDKSGEWVTRFHFFENCNDTTTSPHGHAAFYINIP